MGMHRGSMLSHFLLEVVVDVVIEFVREGDGMAVEKRLHGESNVSHCESNVLSTAQR